MLEKQLVLKMQDEVNRQSKIIALFIDSWIFLNTY